MGKQRIGADAERRLLRSGLTRRDFLKLSGAGLAGASLLGTGCGVFGGGQGGEQGGGAGGAKTLDFNLENNIADLDLSTTTDTVSSILLENTSEGLYRLDENVEPQLAMAEGVEVSDDELTYTFTLREGVTWSNGEPVTSQDFKYSWLRTMNPDTASQYAFIIADYVQGGTEYNAGEAGADQVAIETPDERTLEVTLSRPTPYFLDLTAFRSYFPLKQSFVEEQGDNYALSADALLYNGPYRLTEFDTANGATFEKREDYWDADNVDIQRVDAVIVKEANTALNLYQSGELDRTGLSAPQVEQFQDNPEFSTYTNFSTFWLQFNQEDPVMQNTSIRQAMQRAYDPQALVDDILNDGSIAATGVVPAGLAGPGDQAFREAYGPTDPEFDPEEARRLYQQGVEELGEEPTLQLLTYDTTSGRDVSTFLQGQFQENMGANVEIEQAPFDAKLDREDRGEFQVSFNGWIADYNDPSSFMDLFTTGNSFNRGEFSNERYDELVNGAAEEADNQARMDAFAEAEEIVVVQEAAVEPLFNEGISQLVKPYLKDFAALPYGAEFNFKLWRLEGK